MSNQVETVDVEGGTVSFDWTTGTMTAKWDNGYSETWSRSGYDIDAKAASFFLFTNQFERYEMMQD